MKTIILILTVVLSLSCKKKDSKPSESPLIQACIIDSTYFEGKYYTTTTSAVDTLTIVFIQNNCPTDHSNRYVIKNLSSVMATWGVSVFDKDYYINSDEVIRKGSVQDTLKIESGNTFVRISMKDGATYTPYLVLRKKQ